MKAFLGFLFKEGMSRYGLDIVLQSSVILKSRDLLGPLFYQFGRDALHHSRRDAPDFSLYVRYAREEHLSAGGVTKGLRKSLRLILGFIIIIV
jgi:hypothetical protein